MWIEAHERAFLGIKSRIATRPILRPPDFSQAFYMAVDASDVTIGANSFQIVDGIEHPICFLSKKLDVHQRKYSTVEKEALGLILAVREFSTYFGSTPVTVFTDHSPLVFINRMANHNQKLLRWSLELSQYNLTLVHRRRSDNVLPDILSRPPELAGKQVCVYCKCAKFVTDYYVLIFKMHNLSNAVAFMVYCLLLLYSGYVRGSRVRKATSSWVAIRCLGVCYGPVTS